MMKFPFSFGEGSRRPAVPSLSHSRAYSDREPEAVFAPASWSSPQEAAAAPPLAANRSSEKSKWQRIKIA